MSHIHVAVGVIFNNKNQILIAKRPLHVHLGGLWEFPGGKVESGENVQKALQRELKEELNITFDINNSHPLIKILHQYPGKKVLLDVWTVVGMQGDLYGCEQQLTKWVTIDELCQFDFPEANKAIVTALKLPAKYLITGDFSSEQEFNQRLMSAIDKNIKLIQLRAKQLDNQAFINLAKYTITISQQYNVKIILNTLPEILKEVNADGIHLTASRIMAYQSRPIPDNKYLIASCHNESELQQAIKIGADAVVLGPVKKTVSHPQASTLGWERFAQLVQLAPMPVFALGGLSDNDLSVALDCGAQGIASISAWW